MKNEMFEILKKSGRAYQVTLALRNDEIVVLTTQMMTLEQFKELRGEDVSGSEDLPIHKV